MKKYVWFNLRKCGWHETRFHVRINRLEKIKLNNN